MSNNEFIDADYFDQDELEIDLGALFKKIISNWRTLLVWGAAAFLIGVIISFSIPKKYKVGVMLAPESTSSSGTMTSSLSSLAAMAGVNVRNSSSRDAFNPMMYPDIISSPSFLVGLFEIPVDVIDKETKEPIETTLYDYILNYTKSPWWSKVLGLPGKAVSSFIGLFKPEEEESKDISEIDPTHMTKEQYGVAKALSKMVDMTVDQKELSVSYSVMTQDPEVSYRLAQGVLDRLREFVTEYRTEKSRKNLEYMESLFADAKESYFKAQREYARYVDANQGIVLQRVIVERQRLLNEMNLQYELYNSCAQQLQLAKAKLAEDTPVYAVLQTPSRPVRAAKPSKTVIVFAFVFLGLSACLVWLFWLKDFLHDLKKKDDGGENQN